MVTDYSHVSVRAAAAIIVPMGPAVGCAVRTGGPGWPEPVSRRSPCPPPIALLVALQVVLVDVRGEKEMAPVLEGIKSAGGEALAVQCDVRDRAQVRCARCRPALSTAVSACPRLLLRVTRADCLCAGRSATSPGT